MSDGVTEQLRKRAVEGPADDLGGGLAFDAQVPAPIWPRLGRQRPAIRERMFVQGVANVPQHQRQSAAMLECARMSLGPPAVPLES